MTDTLLRHVFISYNQLDREMVTRLASELERRHIPVWIDRKIEPGNPNYDRKIREAINSAFAVVLVASPNLIASTYTLGEVRLAKRHGVPVYPAWIDGAHWEDSVHTELISSHYMDLRSASFDAGIEALCMQLRERMDEALPRYFAPRAMNELYVEVSIGYEERLAFRHSAYRQMIEFIDDIDEHLALAADPPMYGSGWFLVEDSHRSVQRILLPWSWLVQPERFAPVAAYDPNWYETSLISQQILPGSRWEVVRVNEFQDRTPNRFIVGMASRTRKASSTIDEVLGGSARMNYGYLVGLLKEGKREIRGHHLTLADPRDIRVDEYAEVGIYMIKTYAGMSDRFIELHLRAIHEILPEESAA